MTAVLFGLEFFAILGLSVVVHEFGHFSVARYIYHFEASFGIVGGTPAVFIGEWQTGELRGIVPISLAGNLGQVVFIITVCLLLSTPLLITLIGVVFALGCSGSDFLAIVKQRLSPKSRN